MKRNALAVISIILIALISCKQNEKKPAAPATVDILAANMDTTINPGDDFFMYANGKWISNHPIPASENSWSIGHEVQENIYTKLLFICQEASKMTDNNPEKKKIGDLYFTGMDTFTIEKQGIQPLTKILTDIENIKSTEDVLKVTAALNKKGIGVFFNQFISQDNKKSDQMACYLYQGGLGMPNRDYYFNKDSSTANIRNLYPGHIAKMLMLSGQNEKTAGENANKIVQFETQLAKFSRKLEDLRDPYANYHKMGLSQIMPKLTPAIDWKNWFALTGITNIDSVIIGQPEFYKNLNTLLKKTPVNDLKTYMTWQVLHQMAPYLNKELDKENFAFFGTLLQGTTEQRPRWKRVIDNVENLMGESMGKLFVKEFFPPATKLRYEKLVDAVMLSYKEHIENLDWMSKETKAKSLVKLARITKKVGYPDKWKDFSAMKIDRSSYAENVLNANEWWHNYAVSKLGKPVDRTEWDMTPQTYNAYYNPSNNEIVLPAGIFLIPGAVDSTLDDAVIYGYAAASTIGHELTHGFDDEGRQFDAEGNLKNWWTKEDEVKFKNKVQGIVKQFNDIEVINGIHINGKATAGENIADLGGIVIALDAFKKTEQYKSGKKISGLTPIQRYFLGYALGWLGHPRKEKLAQQLLTDVHSPGKYRVNGPFVNVPDFYTAFNVKEGQKMYKKEADRVKIW